MSDEQPAQPDDSEPPPERQAELQAAYEANVAAGKAPYEGVRIRTRGELSWVMQERGWSGYVVDLALGYKPANLSGSHLGSVDLSSASLAGANLSRAFPAGANLAGADLAEVNLSEAHLWRANLSGTHLGTANLSGADLFMANLRGADLRGAKLDGANLDSADLTDVYGV